MEIYLIAGFIVLVINLFFGSLAILVKNEYLKVPFTIMWIAVLVLSPVVLFFAPLLWYFIYTVFGLGPVG